MGIRQSASLVSSAALLLQEHIAIYAQDRIESVCTNQYITAEIQDSSRHAKSVIFPDFF